MQKALAVGMILFSLPIVLILQFDQGMTQCISVDIRVTTYSAVVSLSFVVVVLILVVLIWRSKDAFKVKLEVIAVAIIWTAAIIGTTAMDAKYTGSTLPSAIIVIVCHTLNLLVCNSVPLYYGCQWEKAICGMHVGHLAHFLELLESIQFRNVFHDFLTKRFCQESLLFYEMVVNWESLRHDDSFRKTKFQSIIQVFIMEGSLCEINIPGTIRSKIMENSLQELPPSSFFSEALEHIIKDLFLNSYQQFALMKESYTSIYLSEIPFVSVMMHV